MNNNRKRPQQSQTNLPKHLPTIYLKEITIAKTLSKIPMRFSHTMLYPPAPAGQGASRRAGMLVVLACYDLLLLPMPCYALLPLGTPRNSYCFPARGGGQNERKSPRGGLASNSGLHSPAHPGQPCQPRWPQEAPVEKLPPRVE